jgi:hypothetical protein
VSESSERFSFGPRDRRGVIAGARVAQLVVVAVALAASVIVLRVVHGPGGAASALLTVGCAIAAVSWPIRGRALDEWVPIALGFLTRVLVRANRDVVGFHEGHSPRRPPGPLAAFEACEVSTKSAGLLGVIRDWRMQTATAVLALGGESFGLLSETDRQRRVDGWSGVLAGISRDVGAVVRVQWLERTVPDPLDALRTHLAQFTQFGQRREEHVAASRAWASYEEFLNREALSTLAHELYLAVTVRAPRPHRRVVVRGSASWTESLGSELVLMAERCRQVGIDVSGRLSLAGISSMLARGFAFPADGRQDWPWPLAFEAEWSSTRTDGLVHATFWISEWPRQDVKSDFLLPLLVGTNCRRTVSVTMAPVPPERAVRTAEQARTSRTADAELKRRHGFAMSARSLRQDDAVLRREHELAAGHGAFRFSAYLTVSASDSDELERSCRTVTHASAICGLEVRRLYGTQADAFCCTLPVGRGCA